MQVSGLSGSPPLSEMRPCAGAGVALYGDDCPFPEGVLLHRLFEEMLVKRGSEMTEKVGGGWLLRDAIELTLQSLCASPQIAVREYNPEVEGRTMTYQDINQVANQVARVLITRAKIAVGTKEPQVCPLRKEELEG